MQKKTINSNQYNSILWHNPCRCNCMDTASLFVFMNTSGITNRMVCFTLIGWSVKALPSLLYRMIKNGWCSKLHGHHSLFSYIAKPALSWFQYHNTYSTAVCYSIKLLIQSTCSTYDPSVLIYIILFVIQQKYRGCSLLQQSPYYSNKFWATWRTGKSQTTHSYHGAIP